MDFSKLDDTKFPNLETASPYALKNTFDYTRWVPNTKVHLVNVLWNGDYSNVVKFDDDTARDNWFDSISDSYVLTLTSNARMIPDGTIKLPLPYDVAARYNYLYIDIPLATSKEMLIQNENELGVRRWYFFIGDVSYSAPNTTVLYLQPDVWTNFIDSARLTYMMLERGHAPVYASDTDRYLANPISNNRYLLAPDVNFDDSTVVRNSKYVPVGNGDKYIIIASTCGYAQIQSGNPGTIGSGSSFTSPTYSDTSDWYGYQLQVNGYGFGNGSDYSNLRAPVNMYNRPNSIMPTSLDTYAIPANDVTFLSDVQSQSPAFLRTIKAMFVVGSDMITLGTSYTFLGHTIYAVNGVNKSLTSYSLSKSMFGFDANEQRFAKLYTFPYSRIEVSDNNGNTSEIRIENTSGIGAMLLTSVAFPIIDCRIYLTGVNGTGSQSYVWKNLNNTELSKQVPNGDWGKLMFDLDIPTFALYMDSETSYMLDSYSSSIDNARKRALNSYHNAVRSANLGYTNSVASADTAHGNSVRDADTAQTNANSSASTTQTNSNNYATAARDNTNATIAAASANTATANNISSLITENKNTVASADTGTANGVSIVTTETNNQTSIATTRNDAFGNIATSVLNGAVSGGTSMPAAPEMGAVLGGATGLVTSVISADVALSNATITTQAASDIVDANTNANSATTARHVVSAEQCTNLQNNARTNQTNNNNDMLGTQRDNNYNTATTNATNLYNLQTANASRTHDTSVTDADNIQTTSNANSARTREIGVLNAKETLETTQDTANSGLKDARRGAPVQLTNVSGDGANMYYGQNGIQFRLRTQSDSAIAQTAAQFARYGYALNQIWDVASSGLNLMEHFTYWKASDVWVDVRNAASSEVGDAIQRMFENGVTVWSNPNEIGKVGIYDN